MCLKPQPRQGHREDWTKHPALKSGRWRARGAHGERRQLLMMTVCRYRQCQWDICTRATEAETLAWPLCFRTSHQWIKKKKKKKKEKVPTQRKAKRRNGNVSLAAVEGSSVVLVDVRRFQTIRLQKKKKRFLFYYRSEGTVPVII